MKPFAQVLFLVLATPAFAQEATDSSETFTRVQGGAVYDMKTGIDGSSVQDQFELTHVTCTDGSKTLRVLLPIDPDFDGVVAKSDGQKSTLKKKGSGYTVDFNASGKTIHKSLVLKPVKIPKSQHKVQFEITLEVGDPLWRAMRVIPSGAAQMMIGTGGQTVELPDTPKFTQFLKSCGIVTG